jgi:hypothetical protein
MTKRVNVFGQPLSYDVGVKYVNGVPYSPSKPLEEGDDVSEATVKTVVKYASDVTHGIEGSRSNANAYPVSNNVGDTLSLETPDGSTPTLSVVTNADGQHIQPFDRVGRILENQVDEQESDSVDVQPGDHSVTYQGDTSFLKKGKSKGGTVDGNHLLSDKDARADRRALEGYVSPILRNNRFNSNKTLSSITGNDKKFNPDHPQEGFGSYKKHARLGTDLSDGHIANVGPMLTLRATKELNSVSSTGYGQDGPDGTGAKAASLLPGMAQVGIAKVSTDDLEVDSVLRALIAGNTEPTNIEAGSSGPRKVIDHNSSYGQMNNVLEQFSGLLPLGMITAAAALAIALNIALRAVLAIFMLITNASNSTSQKRDELGRFIPGDSRYNPAFQKISFPPVPLPAKLFGLQETVNPYGDAVNEGIKVFFGGNIGGSLTRVLEAPGFYATFSRSIVRSAADLGRVMGDVGRGNPIQIAENIIGLIDAIKSSKVVAVMNMFAQIGDVSLQQTERLKRFPKDSKLDSTSETDNLDGLDSMRSRERGSLALAWGASKTPSKMLMPASYKSAASTMTSYGGGGLPLDNLLMDKYAQFNSKNTNKLSTQDVEDIEKILESEYVPFYFHDLRTNEVISFHAFLSNLSEDFSANYDSVDGYGRVDSIKLYRNTQRKLNISFIVAATNQDDFDGMWLKINKLVTLVYPQWSAGTQLSTGDNKFVQPFSQTPSASPMTRIRVGDLWTSNYSKFNLMRVFGLGDDNKFSVPGFSNKIPYINSSLSENIKKKLSNLPVGTIMMLEPGDYEAGTQDQGMLGAAASAIASVASAVGVKTPTNARVSAKIRVHTKVKIVKDVSDNRGSAYAVEIVEDKETASVLKNSNLLVSKSHLSITDETFKSMKLEVTTDNSSTSYEAFDDFFNAEKNAVFKGFEAAKGKGLACLIESMNFDWNNAPWETGVSGARAPKMCKITLSVSVVHDIAPGIDSDGFNRAPVYTVGRQSNAMAGNATNSADKSNFSENMKKVRKSLL